MPGTILDTITEQYNTLTRSGKKLANYLFSNANEAQYLSITSLAENCGVSEASITRFCRSLGLSGYNELKLDLAKTVYSGDFTDTGKNAGSHQDNSFDTTCKKLRDSYLVSLNETIAQIDPAACERAADLLYHARNVYCFGQGGSMVIAMEAWALFSTISPKFVHIADSHVQMMTASLCTSEDVILFFSYSGTTREGLELLQIASEHSVPVILVTHFKNSGAAEFADVLLICGYNENPLEGGSVATKMSLLFIIDCLYELYCQKDPGQAELARDTTSLALTRGHT